MDSLKKAPPKHVSILATPNLKKKYRDFVKLLLLNRLDSTKPKWLWIYKNVFNSS